jgi:hypothetical protein
MHGAQGARRGVTGITIKCRAGCLGVDMPDPALLYLPPERPAYVMLHTFICLQIDVAIVVPLVS